MRLILFFLLCSSLSAQDFSFSMHLEPEEISIDEKAKLVLRIKKPKDYRFHEEKMRLALESEQYRLLNEEKKSNGEEESFTFDIEAWRIGKIPIAIPQLYFSKEDAEKKTLLGLRLFLEVKEAKAPNTIAPPLTLLEETKGIQISQENQKKQRQSQKEALKAMEEKKKDLERKALSKKLLLFSFLASLLAYLLYRYRKKIPFSFKEKEREQDPRKKALSDLFELEKKGLIEKALFKDFYSEISLIIRLFIERQYQLKAPEKTSEEFFQIAQESPVLSSELKSGLKDFLEISDLVKFAKLSPTTKDCYLAIDYARAFIEKSL